MLGFLNTQNKCEIANFLGFELTQKKLLIVEDDASNLELYKRIFSKLNVELFTAQDGKTGLDLILQETPDVVISDVRMPVMSGMDVAREVRKRHEFNNLTLIIKFNLIFIVSINNNEKKYFLLLSSSRSCCSNNHCSCSYNSTNSSSCYC